MIGAGFDEVIGAGRSRSTRSCPQISERWVDKHLPSLGRAYAGVVEEPKAHGIEAARDTTSNSSSNGCRMRFLFHNNDDEQAPQCPHAAGRRLRPLRASACTGPAAQGRYLHASAGGRA